MNAFLIYVLVSHAHAGDPTCEEIKAACEAAKFTGQDMWKTCIEPLVERKPAAKGAKALPKVADAVISACRATHGLSDH